VAWFRKRPDLIEKYCTHGTGWNPGVYAYILDEYLRREDTWKDDTKAWLARDEPINLARGHEYAASIINACRGDGTLFEFNGNVRNFGLVDNLPEGCCVEVPIMASKRGLDAMHVGKLPPQCATLCALSANTEEMAVESAITGDPRPAFWAICYDPLTSAVLSLEEIRSMVKGMFAVNKDYLPQYKSVEF
jgi:alpha-galactosidase